MGFKYLKGIDDSKTKRQLTLEKANLLLNSMLSSLASNYSRDNAFSIIACQLKAVAFEAARMIVTSEDIYNDLIFKTTRPEFIWQNIESFLFAQQAYVFSDDNDVSVRAFLLALLQAYFAGATKASIEAALALAVENKAIVTVTELFLEGRDPDVQFDTVPLQHNFLVSIFIGNNNVDIVKLQNNINFLTSLIKPAHTAINTRFIFTEPGDVTVGEGGTFGGKCIQIFDQNGDPVITPDGFEVFQKVVPWQICDAFHMDLFQYGYEDLRVDCFLEHGLDVPVEDEVPYLPDPFTIKTRFGPLSNGNLGLLDNVNQVTVLVNGNPVAVQAVDALKGLITLVSAVPNGATVTVSYSYLKRHFEFMTLNDIDHKLNQFDPFDESISGFRYSTVIWSPTLEIPDKTPLSCDYRYSGFDGLNSSLLNDAATLVFNKISSRDKLNDYTSFESYNYDIAPVVTLNEGTPLYPLLQEKTLQFEDSSRHIFKLNDPLSRLNSLVYNIIGGQTAFQLSGSVRKIYSDLDVVAECNGGVTERLKPICEEGFDLFFDFAGHSEDYHGLSNESDEILSTNSTGSVLNRFVLFVPRTGFDVSFSRLDLASLDNEAMPQMGEDLSGFHQEIFDVELDYKTKRDTYLLTNQAPTSGDDFEYLSEVEIAGQGEFVVKVFNGVAYVGSIDGTLYIYDVSDPTVPVAVSNINLGGQIVSLHYINGFIFAATNGVGLVSVNVMNSASPLIVSIASEPNIWIGRRDGNLIVAEVSSPSRVVVFDVSVPTNVQQVGSVSTGGNGVTGMAIRAGSYAYAPHSNNNTIYIVSYATPTAPVVVGSFVDDAPAINGLESVAISGTTLYAVNTNTNRIGVWNITNPTSPVFVQYVNVIGTSTKELMVFDKFLYLAVDSPSQVEVWDISIPTAPVYFQTIPSQGQNPISMFVYGNELLFVADAGDFSTLGQLEIIDVSSFYASGFILNGKGQNDLLFPLPIFPIGEELTEFGLEWLEGDTFSRPRFCLNSPNSLLNDPNNPYSIVRSVAGGLCTQSIAEQLLVFELSGFFDGGPFSGGPYADTFDSDDFNTTGGFVDILDGGSFL